MMKKLWVLLLSACLGLGTLVAQDIGTLMEVAQDIGTLMERAQKGNAEAQLNLGVMYFYERGVPQDDAQARKENSTDAKNNSNLDTQDASGNTVKRIKPRYLTQEEYDKWNNNTSGPNYWWKYIPEDELVKITSALVEEKETRKYIREISESVKKDLEKEKREETVIERIFEFILGAAVVGGIIGFLISQWGGSSDTKESTLTGAGMGAMASIGCLWEVFKLVLGFMIVMWVLSFIFGN
jgi:GH18 family chitinase